jgi:tight adherence protein B
MLPVILVVVLAALALVILLAMAVNGPKASKQTQATLQSVLKTFRAPDEEIADVQKSRLLSSIPWLNNLLAKIKAATKLRLLLDQADVKWTPGRLMLTCAAVWVISAYLIHRRIDLWVLSLLLGLAAGAAPYVYVLQKRNRRFRQFQEKLPDVLDMMVAALRAGHSMSGALGMAAKEAPEPIGREFRICFEEQNFGIDLRTAMENLIERVPLQDVRMMTTAMLINKESGGNLAEVLEKTAHVIRDRFRIQQQIRVHTAQGRLTGWILSLLPVVLGTLIYIENPGYMRILFHHPLGHKMVAVVSTMNVIGLLLIRKIVNIRV